jgi:S1-C subfamily serine protease
VSDPIPPRWSRVIELILDTGATKTVLFAPALKQPVRHSDRWKKLEGLSAPTLFGSEDAAIAMVPGIALRIPGGSVRRADVDVAMLGGSLGPLLSRATGRTVHGLLGYSFLRHFQVCIDYPHRVLWLERLTPEWNDRPYEYSHPGLQIERVESGVKVVAVARRSPAAEAGIQAGDELLSVDGGDAAKLSIVDLARRLEGVPGTSVDLVMRRGASEQRYTIVRRQLL